MPWSKRIYVVTQEAEAAGLAFACPSWWDLERLFQIHADRQITLPDGREVLFLSWPHILEYNAGRKEWDSHRLPEREPLPEGVQPQRQELLERLQDARWFIIQRDRAWVVPEAARRGCHIFREPTWWFWAFFDEGFKAWYQEFRAGLGGERMFDARDNIIYMNYESLLTGQEALALDKRSWDSYRAQERSHGRKHLKREVWRAMGRFRRVLQQAVWVVIYEYEWESGLD